MDYSVIAHWVCRPGAETVCTTGLDAEVQNADGSTTAQPFTPEADPPIDCFYIYPTVSQEKTQYADLTDSPEIQAETRAQVGRLSSRCRVFAPIYRQETSYGAGDNSAPPIFGGARSDGLVGACVSPAAPAGGAAMLKYYHANGNPPWVEALGQLSGECQLDSSGANTFVVTVEPGQFADAEITTWQAQH